MREVASKHQDRVKEIQKTVENSHAYFKNNADRFNQFRKFVFDTALTDNEKSVLDTVKKPQIECNITESFISRLCGEFSKQEPSVVVTNAADIPIDPQIIYVVESHIRHELMEAHKKTAGYSIYKDLLSGGYSAWEVFTEYAHNMSFDQVIRFDRVFDPTLCFWDPIARLPHKGDGDYCGKLYPKRREEVEREWNINIQANKYSTNIGGFAWSYKDGKEDIVLVCEYYEKKKKKVKIVKLVDGRVMTMDKYDEVVAEWHEQGMMAQPPGIVGKPRSTTMEVITRYILIDNKILDVEETDYPALPIIFVDGNSAILRDSAEAPAYQMTRPYFYHVKGIQKLKNFALQTWACELENMVMHKWMAPKEAIPESEEWLKAWTNPQIASVFVYNSFKDNDPLQPIPQPREIQRVPAPPEVMQAFGVADQTMQMILGSFDAALGINDNQLSGVAITEGATQSNAAAMPYIVGYLQGLSRVFEIYLKLLPKYYVTPRTIPMMGMDGKKSYALINQQGGISLDYDENAFQVNVEAGVNFSIQKSKALQQIIGLAQSMPMFGKFINDVGLEVLMDNLEIKGIDQLKQMAQQWMQQQQQLMQQQMQMEQQNNPLAMKVQIEQAKLQHQNEKAQMENQIKALEVENERIKLMMDVEMQKVNSMVQLEKSATERYAKHMDLEIKKADMHHRHKKDFAEIRINPHKEV